MMNFRATAYNNEGLTFQFFFQNFNWHSINEVAKIKLDEIVNRDTLHQKNGPWMIRGIDVSG